VARLTIGEAAARLHAAPSTIRSWEHRLGYPTPARSTAGHRLYDEAEIDLLGDALRRGLTISSAIREIRQETGSHDATSLSRTLAALDFDRCDELLEAAIALRGLGRAFDETVLAAVEELLAAEDDVGMAALAVQWTQDRACWARRRAAGPVRHTVVIVDGSAGASATRAARHILQLQLALRSAQALTLLVPESADHVALGKRVAADAIVFVGTPSPTPPHDGEPAPAPMAGFRLDTTAPRDGVESLPPQPRLAAEQLLRPRRRSERPTASSHCAR
jgi:DNA-binding transcriptional MerR regulator